MFYSRLGICAPRVVDYLVDLLTDFVHIRDIYMLKSAGGETLENIIDMVHKAYVGVDMNDERRERFIHRHIGDYTLYWTGLFPEGLERCKGERDRLLDYCEQGKESYFIASELSSERDVPPASLLHELSEHFEDCASGLTIVRRSWSEPPPPEAPLP